VSRLFDTHLLLWAVREPERLSRRAKELLDDASIERCFSVVSLWEAMVKSARRHAEFDIDGPTLRTKLLDSGFREIAVVATHAFSVRDLPDIHRDPFDRLLIAQAVVEGCTFVTHDTTIARYPAKVLLV
jgi:PIN domain nuclease of toxin-antitoxin system